MQRVFDFLRTDDIPALARPSYARELRYFLLWGLVVGTVEGNVAGAVASKTFHAPDWFVSIIWALPISMNTLNLLWGVFLRGRRVVPSLRVVTICASTAVALLAFTSPDWGIWGAVGFGAQMALVHVFMSGLLSLRVSIWRSNYPPTHRARITGRLQTLRLLIIFAGGAIASGLFDVDPGLYRVVYPTIALVGLCSLLPWARFRIRHERQQRRALRLQVTPDAGARAGWSGLRAGVRESLAILRDDLGFRRFMAAQFVLGSANFFTDAVLIIVLARQLAFGYYLTHLMMIQIPIALMLVSIRFWAPYFDRVGVVRFRVRNSALWIASYGCIAAAMLLVDHAGGGLAIAAIGLLFAGRVVNGICRGGGTLAWSIGHLHFAGPQQAELYMGIHVALTGIRGIILPPLGALVNWWIGGLTFAIPLVLSIVALLLFKRIANDESLAQRDPAPRADRTAAADVGRDRP